MKSSVGMIPSVEERRQRKVPDDPKLSLELHNIALAMEAADQNDQEVVLLQGEISPEAKSALGVLGYHVRATTFEQWPGAVKIGLFCVSWEREPTTYFCIDL